MVFEKKQCFFSFYPTLSILRKYFSFLQKTILLKPEWFSPFRENLLLKRKKFSFFRESFSTWAETACQGENDFQKREKKSGKREIYSLLSEKVFLHHKIHSLHPEIHSVFSPFLLFLSPFSFRLSVFYLLLEDFSFSLVTFNFSLVTNYLLTNKTKNYV